METITSNLIKRIGLAAIGQALPETSALRGIMKHARHGLLATVIAGVLLAAFMLLGCFGFYYFLITEGLSTGAAIGLSAGFIFMLAVISGFIAEKHFSKVEEAKQRLTSFPQSHSDNQLEKLLTSFLEGMLETGNDSTDQLKRTDSRETVPHNASSETVKH